MTLLCFTAKIKINLKKLDYSGWVIEYGRYRGATLCRA